MERFIRCLILIVAASVLLGGANVVFASGGAKVEICHTPPNGPGKYHTIKVSENALAAHLAHGDFLGTCSETCKLRCDDGNPCTIDDCDPITGACLFEHPQVNCNDEDPCTADHCNPASGCLSAPISCDDSNECTANLCIE